MRRAIEIALFAILSLTLMTVSLNAWNAAAQRKRAEVWYAHTLDVLLLTSQLRAAVYAELRGERGYLLTSNSRFLAPMITGRDDAVVATRKLTVATRDNPVQRANLARLDRQMRAYESVLTTTVALERGGGHDRAIAIVRSGIGKHHIDAVLGTIARMDGEEKRLLGERRIHVATAMARTDSYQYLLTAFGFVLLGLAAWASIGARRAQRAAAVATAELRRLAETDALTGLANRRAFLVALDSAASLAGMAGPGTTALAILDVDHFKRVNDGYGHPAGDLVLCEIAAILQGCVRATDLVGRLGGEEFAILMPGATLRQAMTICERIRRQVQACPIELVDGRTIRVTLSAGLAEHRDAESSDAIIARADAALYAAKDRGRDRVLLAA